MRWRSGIAAAMFAVAVARGAGAETLTLAGALARARADHPTVRAAAADVEAARGRLVQAGIIPANPVVSADLSRHANSNPTEVNLDRGVDVAQEVEIGGQRGLRRTAARTDVARAERVLADRVRGVDAEVRRAFAGVLAGERRRAAAADAAALAARLLEVTRRRARAGDVGALDVDLARIDAAHAEEARVVAETEVAKAADRLASALGGGAGEPFVLAAEPDDLVDPAPEDALVARALAGRPDLDAARLDRDRLVAEADLGRRRALIPNPTVHGFYRHEQNVEQIAGGSIDIPLPVWNRGQGDEIAARAAVSAAAIEAERLAREIPRQVHLAYVRRAAAARAWERYQQSVLPAARAAGTRVERAYAAGYLGLPEVLAQRDRLLQTRADAITTWLELHEADADLREAVGEEVR
ncbi:MAG: TolC family protein [Candidatus Binatia bacterium]